MAVVMPILYVKDDHQARMPGDQEGRDSVLLACMGGHAQPGRKTPVVPVKSASGVLYVQYTSKLS
jgi:hypothetical protein